MGRGREILVNCSSCGRRCPRDKSVTDFGRTKYTTDLKTADDVTVFVDSKKYYCISCGKHKRIFEKKKRKFHAKMEKYNRQ
ncbi:Ribosomal protein S26e [Candidatus Gugararchaeum adminiculabundum]|nr:Ribosomal protein S26e [Candidatus Gugararchaeum adminiculabundum]